MSGPRPIPPHDFGDVLRNFTGRVRWYAIEGGREGQPQVGNLLGSRDEGLWWSNWTHLMSGYVVVDSDVLPVLVLHDSRSGYLSVRAVGSFDASFELHRDSGWRAGYQIARRVTLPISAAQQYLFYDPEDGLLDIYAVTSDGRTAQVARKHRLRDRSLKGFSDALAVTRQSIQAEPSHLLLLSTDRTRLEIRRLSDPTTTVAEVKFNGRAQRLLPGWYDLNEDETGDDLLVQLPPNSREAPASHVMLTYVNSGDDDMELAANTLVGRPLTSLTTAPLTPRGRSEVVALDRASGDMIVYDTDQFGHLLLIKFHRAEAKGWEQMIFLPDLSGQDENGQPYKQLLLYRSS